MSSEAAGKTDYGRTFQKHYVLHRNISNFSLPALPQISQQVWSNSIPDIEKYRWETLCSTSLILLPTLPPTHRKALGRSKMLLPHWHCPTHISSCSREQLLELYNFVRPHKFGLLLHRCTLALAWFTYTHVSALHIWVQVVGVNIKRH